MTKTKTWTVTGTVVAGTFVGEYEAETGQEAIEQAWADAYVGICHHCAQRISDPEVTQLTAESPDGELVESK